MIYYISSLKYKMLEVFFNNGGKYILLTYFDLRNEVKLKKVINIIKRYKGHILLDSGAFSIQQGSVNIDYDEFLFNYIQFLKKYGHYFDAFVELDIDVIVGTAWVYKATKKLIAEVGQPIVVWHKERGIDYFDYMLRKYKYVGITGVPRFRGKAEVPTNLVKYFTTKAQKAGVKMHGFGYMRRSLPYLGLYSADVSNFVRSGVWGNLYRFTGEYVERIPAPKSITATSIVMMNIRVAAQYSNYLKQLGFYSIRKKRFVKEYSMI